MRIDCLAEAAEVTSRYPSTTSSSSSSEQLQRASLEPQRPPSHRTPHSLHSRVGVGL